MATKWLLSNANRELAANGIFTWSIPALSAKTSNDKFVLTCPNAGSCARLCYARVNSYQFPSVKAAHLRNLEMILDDLELWKSQMLEELQRKRYQIKYHDEQPQNAKVRIHDAGDFFNADYFAAWLQIALSSPHVFFYAYTKEVLMVKNWIAANGPLPDNFVVIYSMGGKQDKFIDKKIDRHAEVFPDEQSLISAGYTNQEENDLLAATLPTNKIGIVANNIPHLKKRQGFQTFGSLQEQRNGILS